MNNIEKIKINGHFVWVDKDSEINENDFILTKDNRIIEVSYLLSNDLEQASKIISASPELKLDVPTYIEWLAEKEVNHIDALAEKLVRETFFIKGYQKAEKELFTEKELRIALSESFKASQESYQITSDEIIERLKQAKK